MYSSVYTHYSLDLKHYTKLGNIARCATLARSMYCLFVFAGASMNDSNFSNSDTANLLTNQ